MDWNKINIQSIMNVLRVIEEETMSLDSDPSVIYSDGKEEIKITYRKLETPTKADTKPIHLNSI